MIFKHIETDLESKRESYLLTFKDGNENYYKVSFDLFNKGEISQIENLRFLDGYSNLNAEQRKEIEDFINNGDWKNDE